MSALASSRPSASRVVAALLLAALAHAALWTLFSWTPSRPGSAGGGDEPSLRLLMGSRPPGAPAASGPQPGSGGSDLEPSAIASLAPAEATPPSPPPETHRISEIANNRPVTTAVRPRPAAPPPTPAVSAPPPPPPQPPRTSEPTPGSTQVQTTSTAVAELAAPAPSTSPPGDSPGDGPETWGGGEGGDASVGRGAGSGGEALGSGSQTGTGAGSGAGSASPAVEAYFDRLYRQARRSLQRHYPRRARRAGEEGDLLLRVRIDRMGRVVSCRLTEASGSATLDAAALNAFERAGPFGAVPDEATDADLEFEYPVEYRLRPGG